MRRKKLTWESHGVITFRRKLRNTSNYYVEESDIFSISPFRQLLPLAIKAPVIGNSFHSVVV